MKSAVAAGIGLVSLILGGFLCVALVKTEAARIPASEIHVAPTPKAKISTEDPAKAKKCKQLLGDYHPLWNRWEQEGPKVAVEVTPRFSGATFDTKVYLAKAFQCYLTNGKMDDTVNLVGFIDDREHKLRATWTPDGGLTFK